MEKSVGKHSMKDEVDGKSSVLIKDTTTLAVTAIIKPSDETIEIAGVRMDNCDLSTPTSEEMKLFNISILLDGDEANADVPQIGLSTIDDYKEFIRAFPYYVILNESNARKQGLFPYTYCGYNKLACDKVLNHRRKRALNYREWDSLDEYVQENGNNALIYAMNSGYVGYRTIEKQWFIRVGFGAGFHVDGECPNGSVPVVGFSREGEGCMYRGSADPRFLMVVRAVSVPPKELDGL